jgi:hypothetical protein
MTDDKEKRRQNEERSIRHERIEKSWDEGQRDRTDGHDEDRQTTRDELPPELGPGDDIGSESDG